MSKKQNKNNQIEITDLIGDAVENAIARREENLTAEEAGQIKGGITLKNELIVVKPSWPPIILGLMIPPDQLSKSIK